MQIAGAAKIGQTYAGIARHYISEGEISRLVAKLDSWCFEPSQPQRITSGLNRNFTLSPSYSFHKSSYHKSCLFSLFIFPGHSTREPAFGRVTYFILWAYTGIVC